MNVLPDRRVLFASLRRLKYAWEKPNAEATSLDQQQHRRQHDPVDEILHADRVLLGPTGDDDSSGGQQHRIQSDAAATEYLCALCQQIFDDPNAVDILDGCNDPLVVGIPRDLSALQQQLFPTIKRSNDETILRSLLQSYLWISLHADVLANSTLNSQVRLSIETRADNQGLEDSDKQANAIPARMFWGQASTWAVGQLKYLLQRLPTTTGGSAGGSIGTTAPGVRFGAAVARQMLHRVLPYVSTQEFAAATAATAAMMVLHAPSNPGDKDRDSCGGPILSTMPLCEELLPDVTFHQLVQLMASEHQCQTCGSVRVWANTPLTSWRGEIFSKAELASSRADGPISEMRSFHFHFDAFLIRAAASAAAKLRDRPSTPAMEVLQLEPIFRILFHGVGDRSHHTTETSGGANAQVDESRPSSVLRMRCQKTILDALHRLCVDAASGIHCGDSQSDTQRLQESSRSQTSPRTPSSIDVQSRSSPIVPRAGGLVFFLRLWQQVVAACNRTLSFEMASSALFTFLHKRSFVGDSAFSAEVARSCQAFCCRIEALTSANAAEIPPRKMLRVAPLAEPNSLKRVGCSSLGTSGMLWLSAHSHRLSIPCLVDAVAASHVAVIECQLSEAASSLPLTPRQPDCTSALRALSWVLAPNDTSAQLNVAKRIVEIARLVCSFESGVLAAGSLANPESAPVARNAESSFSKSKSRCGFDGDLPQRLAALISKNSEWFVAPEMKALGPAMWFAYLTCSISGMQSAVQHKDWTSKLLQVLLDCVASLTDIPRDDRVAMIWALQDQLELVHFKTNGRISGARSPSQVELTDSVAPIGNAFCVASLRRFEGCL